MRITAIEIENFKGISERVRVDLKPITLLFGANSAGKSTILHALLYMKDVLERRNLDAITTPVSGRALDLGGFRNFVHGQDLNRTVRIALFMDLTGGELPEMATTYELPSALSPAAESRVEQLYRRQSDILDSIQSAKVEIEVRWNEESHKPVSFAYTLGLNGSDLIRIERESEELKVAKFDWCNAAVSRPPTDEERQLRRQLRLWDLEEDRESTREQQDEPVPSLPDILPRFYKKRSVFLGLKQHWLRKHQDPIPDFSVMETLNLPESDSDFEQRRGDYKPSDVDYIEIAKMRAWEGTAFLARLIFGPGKLVQDWLQGLRYIGPLRARPPRESTPSGELSDWSEGLAAWKALESEGNSSELIDQVSQWLAGNDRLNSGYKLERKHLAQVDADAFQNAVDGDIDRARLLDLLNEAPKSTQIKLIEKRTGLKLDPSDVGVGISQVLPIIVGAVVPGGSVVAIEQPELHIHPAMQVALGDLFIEGATKRGMSFLIETHSEHLILRLLRRVRETSDGELPPSLPPVKPEDISVVYVDKDERGMRIASLPIDETGEFTERWPRGFFVERGEELF
jgi:predicted ATPase